MQGGPEHVFCEGDPGQCHSDVDGCGHPAGCSFHPPPPKVLIHECGWHFTVSPKSGGTAGCQWWCHGEILGGQCFGGQ